MLIYLGLGICAGADHMAEREREGVRGKERDKDNRRETSWQERRKAFNKCTCRYIYDRVLFICFVFAFAFALLRFALPTLF